MLFNICHGTPSFRNTRLRQRGERSAQCCSLSRRYIARCWAQSAKCRASGQLWSVDHGIHALGILSDLTPMHFCFHVGTLGAAHLCSRRSWQDLHCHQPCNGPRRLRTPVLTTRWRWYHHLIACDVCLENQTSQNVRCAGFSACFFFLNKESYHGGRVREFRFVCIALNNNWWIIH